MTSERRPLDDDLGQRPANSQGIEKLESWFSRQSWSPFSFQRECWASYLAGEDTLLHSSTGSGKTLAAWGGPLAEFLNDPDEQSHWTRKRGKPAVPPLTVLWITPLRSLSADTESTLTQTVEDLQIPWTIQRRTGDSSASVKASQRKQLPTALITTPESLLLLLSYPESKVNFQYLKAVVVDEWHELLGTKRGVQTELALARLNKIASQATRCGLSATLGNTQQALEVLSGVGRNRRSRCVRGESSKKIEIRSCIPKQVDRFPWAGHLGLTMVSQVIEAVEAARSTLVFTNTRNQTEQWYRQLLHARPDWSGIIALHHGSLDSEVRRWVEDALRDGKLKCVVCTSSLDLGVDYSAVDQVIQVGSPKGVARLLQRAGRSGHSPGEASKLLFVPTHAFELIELSAARTIMANLSSTVDLVKRSEPNEPSLISENATTKVSVLESKDPILNPLDCLTQHAITLALADAYTRQELMDEIKQTFAYKDLVDEDLDWALRYIVHGGDSLAAYPDFHRVTLEEGRYQVTNARVARMHRMAMGTIAGDIVMQVKYASGKTLGTVEESYITRLKPGDCFQFAGKTLELMMIREGAAIVKKTNKQPNTTPRWGGGRMPLSSQLAAEIREQLDKAARGVIQGEEMECLKPIFELQEKRSMIPRQGILLVESFRIKKDFCFCIYPFEGRLVHEGLGALVSWRFAESRGITLSIAANDYGFMFQSKEEIVLDQQEVSGLFEADYLVEHLLKSMNATELAKRQFREIARIAGLVHPGIPGQTKPGRHLQASANMFYDAFRQFDPTNKLLAQADRELLDNQFEINRMRQALERIAQSSIQISKPGGPTPLAFPLVVEQLRQRLSSDSLEDRIRKLQTQLEVESR
ncbi:MAG: DEAD/DEAH box helicase [Pirellula sp.]|nr:DEAD/DEAH box helicase [Pirellula sp.]